MNATNFKSVRVEKSVLNMKHDTSIRDDITEDGGNKRTINIMNLNPAKEGKGTLTTAKVKNPLLALFAKNAIAPSNKKPSSDGSDDSELQRKSYIHSWKSHAEKMKHKTPPESVESENEDYI